MITNKSFIEFCSANKSYTSIHLAHQNYETNEASVIKPKCNDNIKLSNIAATYYKVCFRVKNNRLVTCQSRKSVNWFHFIISKNAVEFLS